MMVEPVETSPSYDPGDTSVAAPLAHAVRRCRECNCTDDFACDPPCSWVELDLCSACAPQEADLVNHPPHYTAHPSGVECIEITEHMGFNVGNAVKYLWRADEKGNALEDLRKAAWYVDREIQRRIAGGDLP
jgi:hypothetical protein